MADTKISALPASTTPLAGTEVVPLVQSGATKKVSVANLTAGRAVDTAGGTFTDNQTQGTAAKGINFTANTPAAGKTSQLLNWYEEGTWTPTDASGAGLTLTQDAQATYTRVGRMVSVQWAVLYPATASGANMVIGGLPFTVAADDYHGVSIAQSEYATPFTGKPNATGTTISFFTWGNSAITNADFSGKRIRGSATYFV